MFALPINRTVLIVAGPADLLSLVFFFIPEMAPPDSLSPVYYSTIYSTCGDEAPAVERWENSVKYRPGPNG